MATLQMLTFGCLPLVLFADSLMIWHPNSSLPLECTGPQDRCPLTPDFITE